MHIVSSAISESSSLEIPSLDVRVQSLCREPRAVVFVRNEIDYGTYRYRVHNIVQMLNLKKLAVSTTFLVSELPLLDDNVISRIDLVVFSRTQWSPAVDQFMKRLKDSNIPCYYDIDDLVYSDQYVPDILNSVGAASQHDCNYWSGYVHTCRRVVSKCEKVICTNRFLANKVSADLGLPVAIVPNFMNQEQLAVSERFYAEKQNSRQKGFTLGYFPGTGSHDKDFAKITSVVAEFMSRHADVNLKIVGFLNLPEILSPFVESGRLIKKPLVDFLELQREIAEVDVNLIPLELNDFTNSKSELKFFEAAAVGTVSCASPAFALKSAIDDGETGFLCKTDQEWLRNLESLYANAILAKQIAANARMFAIEHYSGESVDILRKIVGLYVKTGKSFGSRFKSRLVRFFSRFLSHADVGKAETVPSTPIMQSEADVGQSKAEVSPPCVDIDSFLCSSWGGLGPLRTSCDPNAIRRINIMYPDLFEAGFFGGMATSLQFAVRYALETDSALRIITLDTAAVAGILERFLEMHHLPQPKRVDYYFRDLSKGENWPDLVYSSQDVFIATFWTTGHVLLSSNVCAKKVILVQDIETFFYSYSDDHLLCSQVFESKEFLPVVNTQLLRDYYAKDGYENVAKRGLVFEPAFPLPIYSASPSSFSNKCVWRLFVYLRKNPRNIHLYALRVLNLAIKQGLINKNEWEIVFAGDSSMVKFADIQGIRVHNLGALTWQEYSRLTPTFDLALSLMYTPHPSYPPLDCAASGAVVLTNSFKNKKSLQQYCKNILMAELRDDDMLEKFAQAVSLAKDVNARRENYEKSRIIRDWSISFAPVFREMKRQGF